jgi:hypothetical protein
MLASNMAVAGSIQAIVLIDLRMSVGNIANGVTCYCSMAFVKSSKL